MDALNDRPMRRRLTESIDVPMDAEIVIVDSQSPEPAPEAGLPRWEDGLPPTPGVTAAVEVLLAPFLERPEVVSSCSVSISLRLDFQTMTTESAPEVVKKSPPGENAQEVAAPSWP